VERVYCRPEGCKGEPWTWQRGARFSLTAFLREVCYAFVNLEISPHLVSTEGMGAAVRQVQPWARHVEG